MTHTPGPWTAWDDDGTGTLPCVLSERPTAFGNYYVAQCHVYDDAVLASAAPDMFDALTDIVAQAERAIMMLPADLSDSIRVFGKAALAKARGEHQE